MKPETTSFFIGFSPESISYLRIMFTRITVFILDHPQDFNSNLHKFSCRGRPLCSQWGPYGNSSLWREMSRCPCTPATSSRRLASICRWRGVTLLMCSLCREAISSWPLNWGRKSCERTLRPRGTQSSYGPVEPQVEAKLL